MCLWYLFTGLSGALFVVSLISLFLLGVNL